MNILSVVNNSLIHDNRVLNEAESLQRANHSVTICAYYEKGLKRYQKIGEITVVRVNLLSPNLSIFKVTKVIEFVLKTVFINIKKNIDVIHCHDLTTLSVGFLYKKFVRKGVKVVYDAHEYETEYNGLHGIRKTIYKVLEKYLIRCADKVITVSDMIGDEYVRLYAIDNPTIILNCPWKRDIVRQNLFRNNFNIPHDSTIFLYQGIVAAGRGIELLLEVFSRYTDCKRVIVFMGFGSMESLIKEYASRFDTIYFQPALPSPLFLDYTASADFGISFIEDISLSDRYCLPNKLFEYISVGIPVIVSNLPEMKKFVETHTIGVVAENNTASGLSKAIDDAIAIDYDKTLSNVAKTAELYCWETQGLILVQMYADLVNEK